MVSKQCNPQSDADCFGYMNGEITCLLHEGSGNSLEWRITIGGQISPIWKSTCLKNTWLSNFKEHVICSDKDIYPDETDCSYGINKARINTLKDLGLDPALDKICASSYAEPVITSIEGASYATAEELLVSGIDLQNMKTVGGQLVAIYGENFGSRSSHRVVTYQKMNNQPGIKGKIYTCCTLPECGCSDDCRIPIDAEVHSKIVCKTESGVGKHLKFKVEVAPALKDFTLPVNSANLLASRTSIPFVETFKYQIPKIMSIEQFSRVPTEGGDIFTVKGEGFGPPTKCSGCVTGGCGNLPKIFEPTVYYGDKKLPGKFLAECCRVVSDIRIECTTAEGTGHNHLWHLTMAEQTSDIVESTSSYSPPSIARYQPSPGVATEASTFGWEKIIIIGKNFGPGFPLENWNGTVIPSAIDRVSFGPKNGTRFNLEVNGGTWNKGQCHSVAKIDLNSNTYSTTEQFIQGGSGTGAKALITCDNDIDYALLPKERLDAEGCPDLFSYHCETVLGAHKSQTKYCAKTKQQCIKPHSACTILITKGGRGYKQNDVLTIGKSHIDGTRDVTITLKQSDIDTRSFTIGENKIYYYQNEQNTCQPPSPPTNQEQTDSDKNYVYMGPTINYECPSNTCIPSTNANSCTSSGIGGTNDNCYNGKTSKATCAAASLTANSDGNVIDNCIYIAKYMENTCETTLGGSNSKCSTANANEMTCLTASTNNVCQLKKPELGGTNNDCVDGWLDEAACAAASISGNEYYGSTSMSAEQISVNDCEFIPAAATEANMCIFTEYKCTFDYDICAAKSKPNTCTVLNGGTNPNCAAAIENVDACLKANIPNTCTVKSGGTNSECVEAYATSVTCAAASVSGNSAADAANDCEFVDQQAHNCVFVDNRCVFKDQSSAFIPQFNSPKANPDFEMVSAPGKALMAERIYCNDCSDKYSDSIITNGNMNLTLKETHCNSCKNTCTVKFGGTNTDCAASTRDDAECTLASKTGNNGDELNNCIYIGHADNLVFPNGWGSIMTDSLASKGPGQTFNHIAVLHREQERTYAENTNHVLRTGKCNYDEHFEVSEPGVDRLLAKCIKTIQARRPVLAQLVPLKNKPLTGGSGVGALVTVECGAFETTCCVTVTHGGYGYKNGDILLIDQTIINADSGIEMSIHFSDLNTTLNRTGTVDLGHISGEGKSLLKRVVDSRRVTFEGTAGLTSGNGAAIEIVCDYENTVCEVKAIVKGEKYLADDVIIIDKAKTGTIKDVQVTLTADMFEIVTGEITGQFKVDEIIFQYDIGTNCRTKTTPSECDGVTRVVPGNRYPMPQCVWRYVDGTSVCMSVDIPFVKCLEGKNIWTSNYCWNPTKQVSYEIGTRRSESVGLCTAGCRVTTKHKEITCNTADIAGRGLKWKMTVDGQPTTTPTTSYGKPSVLSFSGPGGAKWSPVSPFLFVCVSMCLCKYS